LKYSVLTLPQPRDGSRLYRDRVPTRLRHPLYGWLGLRPFLAQHTAAEHEAIRKWAAAKASLVEIGVAEGVSALAVREVMAENGKLYLIDPFHLSRIPALNFMKRTARRAVESCARGSVIWIEKFSSDAVQTWDKKIDFLLIDGDHSEAAVRSDWERWSRFVVAGGIVLFHDARLFRDGWTTSEYGPVKLVNDLFRRQRAAGWAIVDEVDSIIVVEKSERSSNSPRGKADSDRA
jgi:MMP 1-O-methyltransferase